MCSRAAGALMRVFWRVCQRDRGKLLVVALLGIISSATLTNADSGATYGEDFAGMDFNVTRWNSPQSKSANHWEAAAKECEALCLADDRCCTWTYCTPEGGSADPERCCLKYGVPKEVAAATHWTGKAPRSTAQQCTNPKPPPGPPYPGPAWGVPKVHNSPLCLHTNGWHDIAAALTVNGTHHVMQGCPGNNGWHHAASTDLVHWQDRGINPVAVNEWGEASSPCSGFLVVDDDGAVCAGFRQCSSSRGLPGGHPWDVPLELRCASDANLTKWGAPEYIYDVYFNRALPYDPVRPWIDADGMWYSTIAVDGCNASSIPCAAGGREGLWRSPKLHGEGAAWEHVGPMFTSNITVLSPFVPGAALNREFVTADYFGAVPGDSTGKRRVFTNNVVAPTCCSGTTGFYVGTQAPGGDLVVDWSDPHAVGMIDWGAFQQNGKGNGVAGLTGTASRGFSMARTLGSDPNQVNTLGRRVIIGWVGNTPASQSLPRDLSFSDEGALLQQFVEELQMLRIPSSHVEAELASHEDRSGDEVIVSEGQQLEVFAVLRSSLTSRGAQAAVLPGVRVLASADGSDPGVLITVDREHEFVNVGDRSGPYYPLAVPDTDWMHIYVDHSIVEVIVNNQTAITYMAAPKSAGSNQVRIVGCGPGVTCNVGSTALSSI